MYLHTLEDRQAEAFINAVDVVVRLHDPTDPSTERTAPPSSAHVQLDDVLAFSIQQEGRSSRRVSVARQPGDGGGEEQSPQGFTKHNGNYDGG